MRHFLSAETFLFNPCEAWTLLRPGNTDNNLWSLHWKVHYLSKNPEPGANFINQSNALAFIKPFLYTNLRASHLNH